MVVLGHDFERLFEDFPELDRLVCEAQPSQIAVTGNHAQRSEELLTVCAEQEMGLVPSSAPSDLVDLFLDLERLEVVKLWLVRLKLGVELVLAALFGLVALEKDDATALVA
jgi:hypothetical protein